VLSINQCVHTNPNRSSIISIKLQIQEVKFGRNASHNQLYSAITFWFLTIRINLCKTNKYSRRRFYPRSELPPDKICSVLCSYGVTSKQNTVSGQAPNVVCTHFLFSSFHVLLYLILRSSHNHNISPKYKIIYYVTNERGEAKTKRSLLKKSTISLEIFFITKRMR
jgi:hypothetical protein